VNPIKYSPQHHWPLHEIRLGQRSDIYFWRAKRGLEEAGLNPTVTLQVFQRQHATLAGMGEALDLLRHAAGSYTNADAAQKHLSEIQTLKADIRNAHLHQDDTGGAYQKLNTMEQKLHAMWQGGWPDLTIRALSDGDAVSPWEPVLEIDGPYTHFAHLETIILGVLARQTRIATNVRQVVEAAGHKPVLYFPARFDHWAVQEGDGAAARLGGAAGVSTPAQAAWTDGSASGTVPHALIAAMHGRTVDAVKLFHSQYPHVPLVALVDFDNTAIDTALACAEALGDTLWGVRVDTSDTLTDSALAQHPNADKLKGVAPELVRLLRQKLDAAGHTAVKIVVSGGFTAERIQHFESNAVPADVYGVGSALLKGRYDFTADIVKTEGRNCAKTGRAYRQSQRLATIIDKGKHHV